MKVLTNLDLNKNQILNAVLQGLATAPENPREGQYYYNTADKVLYIWNGTAWASSGVKVEASAMNGHIKIGDEDVTVYELPAASAAVVGGVKAGAGLEVSSDGTLSKTISYYNVVRNDGESDNDALTRAVGEAAPVEGDIAVIQTLIAEGKYSYMAFVYDAGAWKAMDGNVSAENVYLSADIVTAGSYTQVGNITKGANATGSIPAAGKSVKDVFQAIFTKEMNPTATAPAASVTMTPSGAKEVGTKVTPSYTATLSAGSYTYGPATGITAKSWAISATGGETATTATGSFAELTIADNTNYKISATATYEQGNMPVTNLGNEYGAARIPAGSKTANSAALTGYRSFFYGSKTAAIELNSTNIRALTNSNKAVVANQEFQMPVVEGAVQVIVAFPTSINKTLKKVLDVGAFGTDIVSSFTKQVVSVEGANGYASVNYDVYVYAPDAALGANTYKVTIG